MRVAHILPFPAIGGTEIGQLRVMQAARKAGVEGFALYLEDAPVVGEYFRNAGFEAQHTPAPQPSFRHILRFWAQSKQLAAELRRHGATAVHCADVLAAYHVGLAARLAGLPLISHVRNRYEALPFRERFFLRLVERWVFVSRNTWERFCVPVGPGRGQVLYDGVPMPAQDGDDPGAAVRQEFGFAPETVVAGMFARLAPQKDYETLSQAAALLAGEHGEIRFLLVGDHDSTEFIRAHAAKVRAWLERDGVTGQFLFTGFRRDVGRLMRASDLFVLSTHGEGLPLVLLEAMSQGAPVVATAVDGVPELVQDGETGLLVPHGDAPALARAIARLASDRELARRLGETGRRVVETRFSQPAFEARVRELYAGLAGKG
jgi:glycosyltransferase involved in cell wall biosynthesis